MLDHADKDTVAFNLPDPDRVYRYLETCRHLNVEPVPRERVPGLVEEWTEVLSERPEPTTH